MEIKMPPRAQYIRGGEWATKFIFIASRLSLDFAHTGGEDALRSYWERLHQPGDLADWLAVSPLELGKVSVTPEELEGALRLREAIWQTAQAIGQGETPAADDIETINRAAAAPDLAPLLAPDSATYQWRTPIAATAALSTVARDAIDLFAGELRERIRECENPKCSLLFVDASRPGQRRWCAMERCGNMIKTARYRERHGD